jgi:DNA-binding NarL/FixJ family response regulator
VGNLCSTINKSKIATVTGISHKLKECREKLTLQIPDVLLLGLALPDGNGIDFCDEIGRKYPGIKILMLTNDDEYSITKRVMDNGASGFILKGALPEELIAGLKAVMKGENYLGGKIGIRKKEDLPEPPEWLIPLEQEILKLIEKDCSNREIIEKLSLIAGSINRYRKLLIKELLTNDKQTLDDKTIDGYLKILIEDLLAEGYSNWEIAGKLNINIDTVRIYRMDLIQKLGVKNSMMFAKKKTGGVIKFTPREIQLLKLIAAGFTSKEIGEMLHLGVEAINTRRKDLILKSGSERTMTMVMDALRQGLIKLEDIENLTQKNY